MFPTREECFSPPTLSSTPSTSKLPPLVELNLQFTRVMGAFQCTRIVGHISPGIETFAYTELWYPQYVEAYLEIVQDCR